MPTLKLGVTDATSDGLVTPWQEWFQRMYRAYAPPVDGGFWTADRDAVRTLQAKLGIVIDGEFGDRTANAAGYKWPGKTAPPIIRARRPIWFYSAPGSGANWDQGPSFQLGERAKNVLNINHQPLYFQKGGYLGFMGGDPKFSYLEVIADQAASLEHCLDNCPDLQKAMELRRFNPTAQVEWEGWFSGYSQSADGMRRAILKLFGDGGKYELVRDRINGLILFGDPATPKTGIARLTFPAWLENRVTEINYPNDFYANAPDAIRPAFYNVIVEAEMELPFFVHVLQIAVPVILNIIPIFGGLFGPLGQLGVASAAGISNMNLLSSLMGQAGSTADKHVHDDIVEMLTAKGLITNIPALIGLVSALPGLEAHGKYEFDPVMMNKAWAVIARPQRDAAGNRL